MNTPRSGARGTQDSQLTIPINRDVERAVLGAILERPSLFRDVVSVGLQRADFIVSLDREIFFQMEILESEGSPIDCLTVAERLGNHPRDIAYVSELITGVVLERSHVLFHARLVIQKAQLRQVQKLAEELQYRVTEPGANPQNIVDDAVKDLQEIMAPRGPSSGIGEPNARTEGPWIV